MKLKAMYYKKATGEIRARLICLDGGDYPARCIFADQDDWPSDNYSLGDSVEVYIENTLNYPSDARFWIAKQVDSLRHKLNKWREIETLPDEEFEI